MCIVFTFFQCRHTVIRFVAERGGVSTNLTSIDTAGPDHPLRLRRLRKNWLPCLGPGRLGEPCTAHGRR